MVKLTLNKELTETLCKLIKGTLHEEDFNLLQERYPEIDGMLGFEQGRYDVEKWDH